MSNLEKQIDALVPPEGEFEMPEGSMQTPAQARQEKIQEATASIEQMQQAGAKGVSLLMDQARSQGWDQVVDELEQMGKVVDEVAQTQGGSDKHPHELLGISAETLYQAYHFSIELQAEGKFEDSVNLLKFLTLLHPGNVAFWNQLGVGMTALETFDEATAFFEQALALNEEYAEGLLNFALCESLKGDKDRATELINQAIEILRDKPDELHTLEPLIEHTKEAVGF